MDGFQLHSTPFDFSQYAKRMNMVQTCLDEVRKKLPELRRSKYNSEEHKLPDFTPPRIIGLGNKEAGKTLLMYTLAQIPITGKISTYCPVEISLRRRTIEIQWTCVVSVIQFIDQEWKTVLMEETNEKHLVQNILRSAQSLVIDPWGNFNTSHSIIRVIISGATVDLDLIDLPPMDFMRHENRAGVSISQMYAKLLEEHEGYKNLRDANNVLLLISPVDQQQICLQSLLELATKLDHGSNRVFTMADKTHVPSTLESLDKSILKYGFYITRAQSPSETNILEWQPCCGQESEFLSTTSPWCNVEDSRRGMQNLVVCVMALLDTILKEKISNFIASISLYLGWIEGELDGIPLSLMDAPKILLTRACEDFAGKLQLSLNQEVGPRGKLYAEFPGFKSELYETLPLCDLPITDPSRLGGQNKSEGHGATWNDSDCMPIIWVPVNKLDIALGEIWQIMGQCSAGTMDRSSSNYEVDTELMTYVVAKWELICLAVFERINELIRGYVLDRVLEEFKTIILQSLVREITIATLEKIAKNTRGQITMLCGLEKAPHSSDPYLKLRKESWLKRFREWANNAASARFTPMPTSSSLLDRQQPTITDLAQLPARGRRAAPQISQSIARVPQQAAVIGRQRVQGALGRGQTTDVVTSVKGDFLRRFCENETELQNMAKVYGYLEVSIIRLSDNVTMFIRDNFVKTLHVELENALKEKLKNMEDADYKRYAADDSGHASDRAVLNMRKSILKSANEALARIAEGNFS